MLIQPPLSVTLKPPVHLELSSNTEEIYIYRLKYPDLFFIEKLNLHKTEFVVVLYVLTHDWM